MKKCIAYTPIMGSRSAWLPCLRAVEVGERFCRRHGDAITGAVFGALMYGPVVDEEVKIVEDRELPRYGRETVKRKRWKKVSKTKREFGFSEKNKEKNVWMCGS